ncbi:hypothetical protein [Rhodopseudomonas palustris]|uniref:hypothetical protein n=1 Tax=Rhodopseudomonas palustris TaxID=1076 RepID=UPI0012EE9A19
MSESRRLNGLRALRSFGLPTPNWEEVRNHGEIAKLCLSERPFGWTIRTCRTDGQRETGGFFANNLPVEEILRVLNERSNMFGKGEFYIVYPSWKFIMSFNVVFDADAFTVEGKHGSQKGISDGTEMPEVSLRVSGNRRCDAVVYIGDYAPSTERLVRRVLSYLRRVPLPRFYSEVAITTDQQIFFYELFPVGG